MATSSRRSSAPVLYSNSSSSKMMMMASDSSPFMSSSTSYYSSSPSSSFFSKRDGDSSFFSTRRSVSPSRVHLHALSPPTPTPSVRFSIDRSVSPRRSISSPPPRSHFVQRSAPKRTCMCSPTTHPGSFRCALHRNGGGGASGANQSVAYSPNRLNMRRSAMTNSLVRIGTVEGDLVKRALTALIRPSSHQQRRRADFQPRPSRLSVMSRAED